MPNSKPVYRPAGWILLGGLVMWLLVGWGVFACTRAHADEIERINRAVNRQTFSETVDVGTGPIQGGCRLYAEEKARRLTAAGYQADLWMVATPYGLHEIAMTADRVLDNLDPWTESRATMERRGYVFVMKMETKR